MRPTRQPCKHIRGNTRCCLKSPAEASGPPLPGEQSLNVDKLGAPHGRPKNCLISGGLDLGARIGVRELGMPLRSTRALSETAAWPTVVQGHRRCQCPPPPTFHRAKEPLTHRA